MELNASPPYLQELPTFRRSCCFLFALTQCSFVSHTHIYNPHSPLLFSVKKHDSFHTVNNIVLPNEMLLLSSIETFLTNYDVIDRKP